MKLNLGSCDRHFPGFTNVDICQPADQIADLSKAWPWADSSIDEIRAYDVIEHLPDKILTLNEAWRVLKPNGTIDIIVPTTNGVGAFQDPTHVSYWNRNSFKYWEAGNPYRERFAGHYNIKASFRIVRDLLTQTQDGEKLQIVLSALK